MYIDIVFDKPPGPESGRFVEIETEERKSIRFGRWMQRDDGYWVLRIPDYPAILRDLQANLTGRDCFAERVADSLRRIKKALTADVSTEGTVP